MAFPPRTTRSAACGSRRNYSLSPPIHNDIRLPVLKIRRLQVHQPEPVPDHTNSIWAPIPFFYFHSPLQLIELLRRDVQIVPVPMRPDRPEPVIVPERITGQSQPLAVPRTGPE